MRMAQFAIVIIFCTALPVQADHSGGAAPNAFDQRVQRSAPVARPTAKAESASANETQPQLTPDAQSKEQPSALGNSKRKAPEAISTSFLSKADQLAYRSPASQNDAKKKLRFGGQYIIQSPFDGVPGPVNDTQKRLVRGKREVKRPNQNPYATTTAGAGFGASPLSNFNSQTFDSTDNLFSGTTIDLGSESLEDESFLDEDPEPRGIFAGLMASVGFGNYQQTAKRLGLASAYQPKQVLGLRMPASVVLAEHAVGYRAVRALSRQVGVTDSSSVLIYYSCLISAIFATILLFAFWFRYYVVGSQSWALFSLRARPHLFKQKNK